MNDYDEDNYEKKEKVSNKDTCFWVIFAIILFFSISFVVWYFGNGYWKTELIDLNGRLGLTTGYKEILSSILIEDFDSSDNSTFLTGLFGSRISYFQLGLLKYLLTSYIETRNLVNADGSISKFDSQFSVVTNSALYGSARSLCQDNYGNVGVDTFDSNGTQCIPKAKCDCGGNLNVLTNVTVASYLAISTNIKTFTCNNTQYTKNALQIGSVNNDVIVIKANQRVLIETSNQIICFDDLINKLNNLTNVLNNIIAKNNLTS